MRQINVTALMESESFSTAFALFLTSCCRTDDFDAKRISWPLTSTTTRKIGGNQVKHFMACNALKNDSFVPLQVCVRTVQNVRENPKRDRMCSNDRALTAAPSNSILPWACHVLCTHLVLKYRTIANRIEHSISMISVEVPQHPIAEDDPSHKCSLPGAPCTCMIKIRFPFRLCGCAPVSSRIGLFHTTTPNYR